MAFKLIERLFIKRVDLVLTTGEMDSEFLHNYYGINNTLVIRNIPKLQLPDAKIDLHQKLKLDRSKKILLYQGVMIDGRGIELIIDQLEKIENAVLVLLGDGERRKKWEQLALEKNVESKVYFLEQFRKMI
ncbi:MAG: glycosyltransferase [Melioribacteraceae bacterium]|nr:glycosyltransferase [Melioribacteraceae bacterium]